MESMWFYVLCFYIWRTFGKFMFVSSSFPGDAFNLIEEMYCIKKKLNSKNDRKKFECSECLVRKEKNTCSSTYSSDLQNI